jgi:hypothetical protein
VRAKNNCVEQQLVCDMQVVRVRRNNGFDPLRHEQETVWELCWWLLRLLLVKFVCGATFNLLPPVGILLNIRSELPQLSSVCGHL